MTQYLVSQVVGILVYFKIFFNILVCFSMTFWKQTVLIPLKHILLIFSFMINSSIMVTVARVLLYIESQ